MTATSSPPGSPADPTGSRRVLVLVVVAVVALVIGAGLGYVVGSSDDGDDVATSTSTSTTIAPGGGSTTTQPDPDDAEAPDDALWPDGDDDAEDAAAGFVEGIFDDTPYALGTFKQESDETGTVDVFGTGETGDARILVSTLTMKANQGEWFVVGAQSEGIEIDEPGRMAAVSSPATISGKGRGFEGTIIVALKSRGDDDPVTLASTNTQAGSTAELEPFSAEISFDAARIRAGLVVVSATTGLDKALTEFSAIPVTLGS